MHMHNTKELKKLLLSSLLGKLYHLLSQILMILGCKCLVQLRIAKHGLE